MRLGEGRERYGCRCFDLKELAERMGVSVSRARRITERPGFPKLQPTGKGGKVLIPEDRYKEWLARYEMRYAVEYYTRMTWNPDLFGEPDNGPYKYKYRIVKAGSEEEVRAMFLPHIKSDYHSTIERIELCSDEQSAIELATEWMKERCGW